MDGPERIVQDTTLIDYAANKVRVSTAFLGIDVNFGTGRRVLFESVVFGGLYDWHLYRYCTWDQAEDGHATIVLRCKRAAADVEISSLFEARELARVTVYKASKVAVTSLIEHSFQNFQPAR